MKHFIKLIRYKNLAIIAGVMYILRYGLILPLLTSNGLANQLTHIQFLLLTIATVFIAAGGYIINDVYDVDIDKINKPEKLIIGKYIRLRTAENIYVGLTLIAIICGAYVSYTVNLRSLSLLFPIVAGLLYFYSTSYKSTVLLGNVAIAAITALVPFMVIIFELPLLTIKYASFTGSSFNFNFIIAWIAFYSAFAFISTLLREILKDMEDFEGDEAYGKKTIPITWGIKISKYITLSLSLLLLCLEIFILIKYLHDLFSVIYIIPFVITPTIFVMVKILSSKTKEQYHLASKWCKITMATGILYIIFVRVLILGLY
ncbi:MAG TPA: geranylgeranylglycerol-phosphate geranylgeranyltransferase [Bacteroidales bacterium]|nr:geranylgeranylglycerol-phosphate geranylgeranyltransferase [Bacteroidales bacterium]